MVYKSKLLLYAVMVLVIQSGIASATTIIVNDNGEGDYTSIQEAIDVANSGDTILVQNGTYYEHLLLIREDNLTLLGENKETTIIDGSGIGGIIKLISVDNSTIQGFTVQNGTKPSITEGFPTIMGYTQEFLKENYSLTLLEVDVDGKEAWISLSKNGNELINKVIRIGEIYNYEALLSFKLDEIFLGNSKNFIEISNVNQFSEIDNTTKIVDNESALLVPGSIGKFIPTGGGITRELEENYSLNLIDIQTVGDQRKTMLLLLKNNSVIDYDIINVSENYTYYHNGNLTLEAYIEAVFSGEGGIYLAKLSHVYQYSENKPAEILLSDAVYLYSVGNARETEWILEQNYILTAMDMDIDVNTNNYISQLWLRLTKDGDTIEDQFVCPEDNITFYNNGSKILDLTVGIIFDGRDADLATISNVSQYNETDENDRLIQNESHMYIFEYPERDARELDENYSITFMDIDSSTYSNPLVWVRMEKNGILVDDQIIAQNEVYQFYNNSIKIFNASIDTIFSGRILDLLILTNISQYCEENGTQLLVNANWSIYTDNTELIENLNEDLVLYENYTIIPVDIDIDGTKVWMRLYKNNTMADEIILEEGEDYSYYLDSKEIISTTLETVFSGMYTKLIKLVDIYQYSEENGTLLLYEDSELLELQHFSFDNDEGIHIDTSSSNIIHNNNIQDVGRGISLVFSINNTLINNNITDNNYGIHLEDYSNYNSITDNNIINNSEGIRLQSSSNSNIITGNNFVNNDFYGVNIQYSDHNQIYINNFINNSNNADYNSYKLSSDLWNSSDLINYQYNDSTFTDYVGNYWDDYSGSDTNSDGIGDTPYDVWVKSDDYPLIEPWGGLDTAPLITDFKVEPNTSVSTKNPAIASAYVEDENPFYVGFEFIDLNNLIDTDTMLLWYHMNDSGINGKYFSPPWYANAWNITNGTVQDVVTTFTIADWPDNIIILGNFTQNATSEEEESLLWFNISTGNLNNVTRDDIVLTPLTIESGVSTFKVFNIKFDIPDNIEEGPTYTLYTIENENNPYLVSTHVSTGTYEVRVFAEDNASNSDTTTVYVTVDNTPPVVIANPTGYPDGFSAANNDTRIALNASISDTVAGVKNATVNVSQINSSFDDIQLTKISNFWINDSVIVMAPDGTYFLNITAYDNAYNCNDSAQVIVVIDSTRPIILSADANPSIIESNGTDNTLLNVTAIDNGSGIASVTINLSAIGGLSAQVMTNYSGVWQFITNTTIFGIFELPVNVTDNAGNSNTSVKILLIANDTTLPVVIDTLPKNLATDVKISSSITATFSESMNSSTLNDTAIKVYSLSSGKITGEIFENTTGVWNSSNFQGFRHAEELTVFQTPIDDAHRVIFENNLVYSTSPSMRYYQVYIYTGEKVAGSENYSNYSIISWLGDEYVAVNGTPNKLTKLVFEQKSYETKTMQVNEIWDMGDGYSLGVAEIDYDNGKAWLDLYKNGQFDSEVISNQSYWCVEDDIAGESKVPIFITYLDKVSDNTIQLKYTWLISQDVTVINSNESFGVFEVKSISSDAIRLKNDENVSLTRGNAIPLANDLKFEVEDTPTVRYCLVGTGEIKTGLGGDISYESASRTVTFDPVSNLMSDTNYISYITTVAEDLAGNGLIEDYEWEFKTMYYTTPSRNGGGGGGGGGSSGEDFYNIVISETDRQSVFKNSNISFSYELEGNIVRYINFTALNSAGTVAAKVEILNHTSTLVSVPPPDEVFNNLNIWVGNYGWATEKNMVGTTISFMVEKSWITDNDIDETTIALYRYSDDSWDMLVTRKIAEDANSLQFEAETPGFSPFAVTGKKTMEEPGDEGIIAEPTITAEKTPVSTPTEKKGVPGFSLFVGLSILLIAMRLLHKKN